MFIFSLLRFVPNFKHSLLPILALIVLTLVSSLQPFFFLMLTPAIFDKLFTSYDSLTLLKIIAIYAGVTGITIVSKVAIDIISAHINQKMALVIRLKLMERLSRKTMSFFQNTQSGALSKQMIVDTELIAQGLQFLCIASLYLVQILLISSLYYTLVPWFFNIYIVIALVYISWSLFWKFGIVWTSKKIAQDYEKSHSFLWETFDLLREIKFLNLYGKISKEFNLIQSNGKRHVDLHDLFESLVSLLGNPLVYVGYAFVLFYSLVKIEEGVFTIGTFAAFSGVIFNILTPVILFVESIGTMQRSGVSAKIVSKLLNEKEEQYKGLDIQSLDHSIAINELNFSYDGKREILKGLAFTINKGEWVSIVGPTGCGKSTLLNILLKMIHPNQGHITIDNQQLQDLNTDQWRDMISYLGQDNVVFLGTIKDNIDIHKTMSDEQVKELLQRVNLLDVVNKLKEGIHTTMSQDGAPFSGGELQRLYLSRLLAKDSEILILDEATSALDPHTESFILEELKRFSQGKTIISVSHRLNWVKQSNKVFVMNEGVICEEGSPQYLQEHGTFFKQNFALT